MFRVKRIIPRCAKSRHANVSNRKPSFELMVPGPVKDVRNADRGGDASCLKGSESCTVVDDLIREQDLFPASRLHVDG